MLYWMASVISVRQALRRDAVGHAHDLSRDDHLRVGDQLRQVLLLEFCRLLGHGRQQRQRGAKHRSRKR